MTTQTETVDIVRMSDAELDHVSGNVWRVARGLRPDPLDSVDYSMRAGVLSSLTISEGSTGIPISKGVGHSCCEGIRRKRRSRTDGEGRPTAAALRPAAQSRPWSTGCRSSSLRLPTSLAPEH
jgi:hypothetical protein